jgi:hypothetical protein
MGDENGNLVELRLTAILHEYDFMTSLIRMYRGFQMQAVGLALGVYGAIVTLIGSAVPAGGAGDVVRISAALVPWPATLLLLAFAVTEVRIARASGHVAKEIAPLAQDLLYSPRVLNWERSPGRHLTPFQARLSTSEPLIALVSAPPIALATWYLLSGDACAVPREVTAFGLAALVSAAGVAATITRSHERRRELAASEPSTSGAERERG